MTKILTLQNSIFSYLRITKSMYRCLVRYFTITEPHMSTFVVFTWRQLASFADLLLSRHAIFPFDCVTN